MTTILVTGGNGQLASTIKDVGVKYNDLRFIYTDYQDLDICNENKVKTFFSKNKIDYCINCAAYTAVDLAEKEIEKAFDINANGVRNLALSCKQYDTVLIHISTDFVFDGEKREPYTEEDRPNPINVYGASKLKGEQYVQDILKQHFFIIRTSWVYSEYGNNFVKTMLRLGKEKEEIKVVSDQVGCPTYAGNLARLIVEIVRNYNNIPSGIYHYSDRKEMNWYEFAKEIFYLKKIKINIKAITTEQFPALAVRPKYSVLSKNKILKYVNLKIEKEPIKKIKI